METIGLIGGMSWHSTIEYYRVINERVAAARGGHASAPLLLSSVDFEPIRSCQIDEDWAEAARLLTNEARRLEAAGASSVAICTNLMHKVAPEVSAAITVPLVHIVDAIADRALAAGHSTLGIVGTAWVMREPFYRERLEARGIRALVPPDDRQRALDAIIWSELTRGITTEASRAVYRAEFGDLAARGAEAIVLSCTEITLLVGAPDSPVPLIDSMVTHAAALAERCLGARAAA